MRKIALSIAMCMLLVSGLCLLGNGEPKEAPEESTFGMLNGNIIYINDPYSEPNLGLETGIYTSLNPPMLVYEFKIYHRFSCCSLVFW